MVAPKIINPFRLIVMWLRIAGLMILAIASPLSFLDRDGFGIVLENTAFGWVINTQSAGVTNFEGYGTALDQGYFFAFAYKPALNPKPPLTGTYFTSYGVDDSHWLGSVKHEIGIGTLLTGNLFHSRWTAQSGIAFPFWPVSIIAGILLFHKLRHLLHSRKIRNSNLCPTCSYDLRAHASGGAGANCPECGTPIPQKPTPKLQ